LKEKEKESIANSSKSPVPSAPGNMSNQLKSLLGVKSNSGASPWSNIQATPASSTSLRDIMMEEMSQQQQQQQRSLEAERQSGHAPAGSSWAAKMRSGVPPVSPPVSISSNSTPPIRPVPAPVSFIAIPPTSAPPILKVPEKTPIPVVTTNISQRTEKSEFGGKQMSKEMADWCTIQLRRINGSDDITLMHFCMSLNSGAEIRETLSSYLGSTPQVRFTSFDRII
jgi:hypothetical protein